MIDLSITGFVHHSHFIDREPELNTDEICTIEKISRQYVDYYKNCLMTHGLIHMFDMPCLTNLKHPAASLCELLISHQETLCCWTHVSFILALEKPITTYAFSNEYDMTKALLLL